MVRSLQTYVGKTILLKVGEEKYIGSVEAGARLQKDWRVSELEERMKPVDQYSFLTMDGKYFQITNHKTKGKRINGVMTLEYIGIKPIIKELAA